MLPLKNESLQITNFCNGNYLLFCWVFTQTSQVVIKSVNVPLDYHNQRKRLVTIWLLHLFNRSLHKIFLLGSGLYNWIIDKEPNLAGSTTEATLHKIIPFPYPPLQPLEVFNVYFASLYICRSIFSDMLCSVGHRNPFLCYWVVVL